MAEQQFISKIKYSNIDYFIKASKIANSLTIQLNGNETKVTFDGSAAKTINITANSIGAAPASLSGTVTDLTNSLTLVKNIVDTTNNRIVLKRANSTKVDYIDGNDGLTDSDASCTYTLPGRSGQLAVLGDIPTVNNATLTIQKNGVNVATFTANSATNTTANIAVPTKVSQLTNDSGFVSSSGVTSVATSGMGLSGGTITSTGTITLDSSSAGNAAANKVILRNAAGSIQTEKLAVSSGTTTKATMQYNATEDCIEFVFA